MYTNLQDWYELPVVLPNVGRSDHRAVLMLASATAKHPRGQDITVMMRSQDSNSEALLAQALKNLNWTPLYNMQSCEDMVTCFHNTVTSLLDHHLLLLTVRRHTTDKPWVTDQFRRLIWHRQNAFRSGDKARNCKLRNQVQWLTRQLRRKYFVKRVNGLQTSNPRNWWRTVKQVTGLQSKSTEPLVGLAQRLHDGDMHKLTNQINKFFEQVAAD